MKPRITILLSFIVLILTTAEIVADDRTEPVTVKNYATNRTQLFMQGHEGDINWLAGFEITADMYFNGNRVGTTKGRVMAMNPPLIMTAPHINLTYDFTYDWEGVGTWQVKALGLALTNSDVTTNGEFSTTWMGTVSNGTEQFEGVVGVATGLHKGNFYTFGKNPSIESFINRYGF